jgi:2-phosphoglycerate kinase
MNNTKIILIGGVNGSGKTTIAKALAKELKVPHRLGIGFMREAIRSFVPKEEEPLLYCHSFKAFEITGGTIEHGFREQTKLLSLPINSCINRAQKEGTGLILDGTQLLPEFIPKDILLVFLFPDKKCDHYSRIHGKDTHSKRQVSKDEFNGIKQVEKYLRKEAKQHNVPIIFNQNVDKTVKEIVQLWREKNDS